MQTVSLTSKQGMLIGAAASGDRASVEALLDEGVEPNGTTTDGRTALDVAATDAIRNLLRKHDGRTGPGKPRGLIAGLVHRVLG